MSKIKTINPATGKILATYENVNADEVSRKAKAAREESASLVTEEMGKPIRQSLAEIEKCAWVCDYYAEHAEAFLRDEIIPTEFRKSFVSFEPLGVVACIMPWNFPFWQVMRFAVPALTAGNVGILKHSSICLGSAIKIEQAFVDAGFPENIFQAVIGDYRAGEALVQSNIDAVSVTGSVNTGRRVA